jgi:hypothetical protein
MGIVGDFLHRLHPAQGATELEGNALHAGARRRVTGVRKIEEQHPLSGARRCI